MTEKYHMIEYIHEGPKNLKDTLAENEDAVLSIARQVKARGINRVVLTGLGSSYTAAMMAAPLFYNHCPCPTLVVNSTESPYYAERWVDRHSLVVVVSRSGERGQVVDAVIDAQERGALAVAMTGVADSLLAEKSNLTLLTREGPEITFPKTKSVLCCAGLFMRLGLALASEQDKKARALLETLNSLPPLIEKTIQVIEPVLSSSTPILTQYDLLNVVGTASNYGVSLEAAVKIQEASYITVRGDSTSSLLHGPVGALSSKWLVMALVTAADQELSREMLGLVKKFGAYSFCVQSPDVDMAQYCDKVITLPQAVDPMLAALVYLPAVHLTAYYMAIARNMNPDAPSSMRDILDVIVPKGREEPELRS